MSRSLELLALRKELLVAQASVQRLRIAQQLGQLREELRVPQLARSVVHSQRGRATLFTLLLMVAGRGRFTRWVRRAALVVSVAGLAHSMLRGPTAAVAQDTAELPPPAGRA